jgi:lipoyl(octanoyl) transferase
MNDGRPHILYMDLGLMDYQEAWNFQEERFNRLVSYKRDRQGTPPEQYLLFCEHPHVYTLGKSGDESNLLIHKDFLNKIKATYYKTNRGGDITYHGPGQIVGYPILDLECLGIGLKQYVHLLEEAIIRLLKGEGITASRMEGATGVWLDAHHPVKARKICAIGVRSSRHVTMHGFALNVNTNLDYFTYINPCGFDTKGVTSMEKELKRTLQMEEVKEELKAILLDLFLTPAQSAHA